MNTLNFYGANPSIAIKNIVRRKNERLNLKNPKNGIKTALIVQGGSMRGIFSAGALIALEKMGFSEGFDSVYASSGGALNVSYFLSKQAPFGTSIYYENINNSKFINVLRIKKIVGINYLFKEIIGKAKPLEIKALINSKTNSYFFATDNETGKHVRFTPYSKNFLEMLKASCAMPFYYDKTVSIDGKNYSDGGVSIAIPIEEAIRDGCTDILVLLTQSVKSRNSLGSLERFAHRLVMPELRDFIDVYLEKYKHSFDISIGKAKTKDNVNIASIIPDDNLNLNRLSRNQRLLKNAAIQGTNKLFELFNKKYKINNILSYN